jgi:hypothetical protein
VATPSHSRPVSLPCTPAVWTLLPFFHSCCFISAAGRHPSEIDPHSSHASLTCPVCHVDFSADPEGLPARIAGYSGSSLSLLDSPSESASWSPPRQPQALPPPPVHVHPDTRPFTWCPLRCPATHEMCGHCWRWQEEGLAHVQSAHHPDSVLRRHSASLVDSWDSWFDFLLASGKVSVIIRCPDRSKVLVQLRTAKAVFESAMPPPPLAGNCGIRARATDISALNRWRR